MLNFLALLLGLLVHRAYVALDGAVATGPLVHYGRAVVRRLATGSGPRLAMLVLAALLPAAGIAVGELACAHGIAYVLYSAAVLVLALGPRDLAVDVDEWLAASRAHSPQAGVLEDRLLSEHARERAGAELDSVADVVLVQAHARVFGVLFWFAVLGPAGAVLFRTSDVLRRTALGEARDHAEVVEAALKLQSVLDWAPARLLALSYGLAGSFDDAFRGWRGYLAQERDDWTAANEILLVHAGRGALGDAWTAAGPLERAELVLRLVRRARYAWLAVVAVVALVVSAT